MTEEGSTINKVTQIAKIIWESSSEIAWDPYKQIMNLMLIQQIWIIG